MGYVHTAGSPGSQPGKSGERFRSHSSGGRRTEDTYPYTKAGGTRGAWRARGTGISRGTRLSISATGSRCTLDRK